MNRKIALIKNFLFRNSYTINHTVAKKNRVNLENWTKHMNIGDQLSEKVYQFMLSRQKISANQNIKKTVHLLAIGSVLGIGKFDAVVWGSGFHLMRNVLSMQRYRRLIKLDIRAVRGPVTKLFLEKIGYDCTNAVMGDPAIIMPLIYTPNQIEKKYDCSIIGHYKTKNNLSEQPQLHSISVETKDYQKFIDELVASKMVISSSLHGIILAETYGVPAIFLNPNHQMDQQLMKYLDWYYSTGRDNIVIAHSVEEALTMKSMPLPDLSELREGLLSAFPYDLWHSDAN